MVVRCDACGAVSRLGELYVREPGLRRHDELHCPACHDPAVKTVPLPGWPAAVAMVVLLGYWLLYDDALWPVFLVLLFPALTILHELLHAIPAWLLGARVLEIRVGGGKRPAWTIGGVRVAVTNWLVGGGFCAYAFRRAPVALWRHLVITGTPLAFHLGSTLLLLWTGLPVEGEGTVLQVYALVNGFIFLENVYPSGWSDGHQLAQLLRRGRAWADASCFRTLAGAAFHELEAGRRDAAIREARAAERWMPNPALGASLFQAYLEAGAYDDAERMLPNAGHVDEPLPEKQATRALAHGHLFGDDARRLALVTLRRYQDRLEEAETEVARWLAEETREAVRAIVHGHQALVLLEMERVAGAERAGREAFACMPWLPLVKLVYGAVLVAKEAYAGGVKQLADVEDEPFAACAAAWRAIGWAALGRPDEAGRALELARKGIGAPPRLRARAERAVAAARGSA